MKLYLYKLAIWILHKLGSEAVMISEQVLKIVPRARELCSEAEQKYPGTSGELKRHQVYARLIKEFPSTNKRDLGLSIELALR